MKRFILFILGFALMGLNLWAEEKGLVVESAKLCGGVENREPVGEDSVFSVNEKVFLWMKVTGGASDTISVTWKIGDQQFPFQLAIAGSPWRTWAKKTVWKAGEWSVEVKDREGNLLKEMTFLVREKKEGE